MLQELSVLDIAGFSDTGLMREHNEDCIGFDTERGIAVLADGMGGHQAGEVASRMAVQDLIESLGELLQDCSEQSVSATNMFNVVCSTIASSNRKIFEASETNTNQSGMGTTVIAAVVQGSYLYAGHVGDSRLYMLRDRLLKRITRDHSLVQDLVDKGFYTEDEARNAAISHVVTRALGTAAEVEVDLVQQETRHDDLFLLCSDGLTDMLPDHQIEGILQEAQPDLDSSARNLINLANLNGGKDNVSVILMRVQHPESSRIQPRQASRYEPTSKLTG